MEKDIRVIIANAGEQEIHLVEKFEHSLEHLQAVVGGYIEAIRVNDSITIWINEEGKLIEGMKPNFYLIDTNNKPVDIVLGDIIITGTDEEGETISLTDQEIEEIQSRFITRKHFRLWK
ncbi:hypothetical protein QFZ31_006701 [Neobacillus niacini]|uniref:DUF3846 domain-containing protein n=1 Tax=Neobacillus driksii TaxID=3035913 RepID=UPI00278A3B61|nr:DUF3846 domain-containing protein [Neobacillus niacini]MDQ0976649.1 hypothetical protein [Neobacillus niacini]